jgi:hypothetical protein
MTRISYSEEEPWQGAFELFRANTDRQLAGRKGQATLRELEAALLALPEKRLISNAIACGDEVCAVGALLVARRVAKGEDRDEVLARYQRVEPEDDEWGDYDAYDGYEDPTETIAAAEGVPRLVAWRLAELNDMLLEDCTPEERYTRVLDWVRSHLK